MFVGVRSNFDISHFLHERERDRERAGLWICDEIITYAHSEYCEFRMEKIRVVNGSKRWLLRFHIEIWMRKMCMLVCCYGIYIYIFVQLIYNNEKRLPKTESSTVSRKAANKTFSNCLCVRKLRIRFWNLDLVHWYCWERKKPSRKKYDSYFIRNDSI